MISPRLRRAGRRFESYSAHLYIPKKGIFYYYVYLWGVQFGNLNSGAIKIVDRKGTNYSMVYAPHFQY